MSLPETCGGCGQRRTIVAQYPNMNNLFVCLECNLRIQDADIRRRQQHAHEMNSLIAEMEMASSLPYGSMPRQSIPQPAPRIEDRRIMSVTNNHITVTGGTVGSINTGHIGKLNVAIDQAHQRNDIALAEAIRQLGNAIANSPSLSSNQKNEANECFAFLVEQAAKPEPQRQTTIVRATSDAFLRILSISADLLQVWGSVGEPIRHALGL